MRSSRPPMTAPVTAPMVALIAVVVLVAAACGGTADAPPQGPEETPEVTEPADETITPTDDDTATPTDDDTAATADDCGQYEPESQVTDEAVLLVDRPSADGPFPPGSTVEGCTNAFEAAFQWELLDADGQVVASGNEMASCGSGCLGTFSFDVDYDVDEEQEGVLRLFVESAEDGSVQMTNETLVHLEP